MYRTLDNKNLDALEVEVLYQRYFSVPTTQVYYNWGLSAGWNDPPVVRIPMRRGGRLVELQIDPAYSAVGATKTFNILKNNTVVATLNVPSGSAPAVWTGEITFNAGDDITFQAVAGGSGSMDAQITAIYRFRRR